MSKGSMEIVHTLEPGVVYVEQQQEGTRYPHIQNLNLLVLEQHLPKERIPLDLLENCDTLGDFLLRLVHPAAGDSVDNFGTIAILVRCGIQQKLRALLSYILSGKISLSDIMDDLKALISSGAYKAITDEMKKSPQQDDETKIAIVLKHIQRLLDK